MTPVGWEVEAWRLLDGTWVAVVHELAGISGYGATEAEAVQRLVWDLMWHTMREATA